MLNTHNKHRNVNTGFVVSVRYNSKRESCCEGTSGGTVVHQQVPGFLCDEHGWEMKGAYQGGGGGGVLQDGSSTQTQPSTEGSVDTVPRSA